MASAKKNSKSSATSRRSSGNDVSRFVICIRNTGYEVSLEKGKVYPRLPDRQAQLDGLIRVVDESGEDYLFPAEAFLPIALSREVEKALRRAS